eukprot:3279031-Alexandrium_andersonii.AAC.1
MSFSGPHCKASCTMNWWACWASQKAQRRPTGTTRRWNHTGCAGPRLSRAERADSQAPAPTAARTSPVASAKLMGGEQKNLAR